MGFATKILFCYTFLIQSSCGFIEQYCMNIIHIHEGTENTFNVIMNLFYIFFIE